MRVLVKMLQEARVPCWIISASAEVLVDPVAEHLGIPAARVIGIRLHSRDGVLLPAVELPLSYAAGKVCHIQRQVRPDHPGDLLVFGDSYTNDGPMLRYAARHGGLAVLINPKPGLAETLAKDGILGQTFPSLGIFEAGKLPRRKD
jgi:phosphoserine phosphatase